MVNASIDILRLQKKQVDLIVCGILQSVTIMQDLKEDSHLLLASHSQFPKACN
jgi:hypothetical protein